MVIKVTGSKTIDGVHTPRKKKKENEETKAKSNTDRAPSFFM